MIPLPGPTPKPGEIGSDVIQVGYLRGVLQRSGRGDVCLDRSFIENPAFTETFDLKGVQQLRERLRPLALNQGDERIWYIEDFIKEVENAQDNSDLRKLYDAVRQVEEKEYPPHPMGLGLVALHFYYQDCPYQD